MSALTRYRDAVAGAVAVLLAVVYIVGALQIEPDPSAASVIGPSAAPLAIGAATLLCGVALAVRGLRRPGAAEEAEADPVTGEAIEGESSLDTRKVLVTFAVFAAYVVAFIPLGFLLSTFLFMVALPTYVDRTKGLRNVIVAAGFAAVVYLLFERGLRVELPPGLLG